MIKIRHFAITATAAFVLAACGGTAENKPANANSTNSNANANAVKTTAAAPSKEALLAMDKQANEAWMKGDAKFFEGMLSDKFVSYDMGHRMSKADTLKMMGTFKCDMKTWSLDDAQMVSVDADTAIVTYKGTFDGTCTGEDGKAMKVPSPTRAASIWVRNGDKWQGVYHGETLIIDPKNPPKMTMPPPPPPPAKDEAKADKPTPSANTEALVKLHTAGWEAWKAKDMKKLEEMSTANLSIVDPIGTWHGTKADVIKAWTEMKCEGVNSVKVENGFASAISPTVELLTLQGTSDGSCDGQKNGKLNQSALYVKEGDAWKLAFMFESPAM